MAKKKKKKAAENNTFRKMEFPGGKKYIISCVVEREREREREEKKGMELDIRE